MDCRLSVEDYGRKISYHGKIPRSLAGRRTASALAEISLLAAYEALRADHPQPVGIRSRADALAQIVAPFSIMIAVFAVMVHRPAVVCIAIAVLVNAMVAVMKFTSRGVAKHAADRAVALLRAARIPREEDEKSIEQCIRSLTWR
ncbi:MAG: hypothetical protein RI957_2087 [Verrucomicrobiota bacterium]